MQVTDYGVSTGERMTKDWRDFWMRLFARFRDLATTTAPKQRVCDLAHGGTKVGCTARPIPTFDESTGYTSDW